MLNKEVNVCDANQIGHQILNAMTGKAVDDYVFTTKYQLSVSTPLTRSLFM